MDYLHKVLHKLKHKHDFNFRIKCEKLAIINLSFADDLLLFTRDDPIYVKMVMIAFNDFYESTGLKVNPSKCIVYFGNVDDENKQDIHGITMFNEGALQFRYLSIPLTSKKLAMHHYMVLVDKIVARINHWSARLLNFAGRIQLINNILFSITNYWMQCIPISKKVIKRIEVVCRSFLWSSSDKITRKSPIAWKRVCSPKSQGDLNIISLEEWNKANLNSEETN